MALLGLEWMEHGNHTAKWSSVKWICWTGATPAAAQAVGELPRAQDYLKKVVHAAERLKP